MRSVRRLARLSAAFVSAIALAALLAVPRAGCAPAPQDAAKADLIVVNGKVVTMDPARPEARALAARGSRIVAVGSVDEIRALSGPSTMVIDAGGRLVVPGLIESHGHFTGLGESKQILDLTKARSWEEIVALVAAAAKAARPGDWIEGRGWHQDKWDRVPQPNVDGLPVHDALSRVSPDNPVVLTHASGHSCLANAKAMEVSKVTRASTDPEGGTIVRDAKGEPIGAFLETAQGRIRVSAGTRPRTLEETRALVREQVELAAAECLARGVTSFHDAGAGTGTVDVYRAMAAEGALPVRLYVMMSASVGQLRLKGELYRTVGGFDDHLTIRSIKRLIDGALGAHGAWLLEPYADLPSSTGLNTEPLKSLRETAEFAAANGWQLCVHAIGDRGNRETLDIYEAAFRAHADKTGLRWRIEHAQHLSPADVPRFAKLGVVAAMQGVHCTSDAPWIGKRLGERRAAEESYLWRALLDSGAVVCNGTDVPVEAEDPMACFYASVTRRMADGRAFTPAQRMTREEALRSYTVSAAYAAFEEGLKGSLAPGKLADVAILSRDILTCPEEEIRSTEAVCTIVGGKVLHRKGI